MLDRVDIGHDANKIDHEIVAPTPYTANPFHFRYVAARSMVRTKTYLRPSSCRPVGCDHRRRHLCRAPGARQVPFRRLSDIADGWPGRAASAFSHRAHARFKSLELARRSAAFWYVESCGGVMKTVRLSLRCPQSVDLLLTLVVITSYFS